MDLFSAILPCYDLTNAFISNLLQMVPFAVNVFCLGILEIHFERKFCQVANRVRGFLYFLLFIFKAFFRVYVLKSRGALALAAGEYSVERHFVIYDPMTQLNYD